MRKIVNFVSENILFIFTLFLLFFIPLYPKLPLLDVQNTWVYIRVEDLVIASVLTLWVFLILLKKVKLKTPLTFPIFLFWVIGAISTLHGVLILFPTLPNVFSNVAFLSFIRRVEYLSLFFIAYAAMRDKKFIYQVIAVLSITLLLIVAYGLGQRFFGFPAYLTGNEEFAKGIALKISPLGRITSTFAGHYDLAAYLVLIIPILVSLSFGFRNLIIKASLLLTASLGFILLFMTVSRVSFFALLLSLLVFLILQKKRLVVVSLFAVTFLFLIFSPSLLDRFGNTVSEVNVLVDAKTGEAISEVKELPREYFKDKVVLKDYASIEDAIASSSAIIPYPLIPPYVQVLIQPNAPSGETLPQGTGYVNLPLSPILKRTDFYFSEKSTEVRAFTGKFLVKRAKAYDLSFTTRFQGEWPKTIDAFKRNIFLGSGYGSVGLAVDNNYLRILGESGLFGFISFISLFLIAGIYIKKTYPKVDSPIVRSFVLGFATGTFGLLLNGTLIDVFEASKVAFAYWLLMGVTLGILHLYNKEEHINLFAEFKKAISSPFAIIIYLLIITVGLFSPLYSNYFVGDDFTWLRWVADSQQNVFAYFTDADGFFYRPGARLYFFLMYKMFWLNQTFYHLVSIFLHFSVALLLFAILRNLLKNYALSITAAILFLILSGHHEAVFWISSTGFLFTSVFILLALLLFILWREKKKPIFLAGSLASIVFSLMFHELGVVAPLIIIAYDIVFAEKQVSSKLLQKTYLILLSPLLPYLVLRFLAQSHWFSGDYSYNIFKLPYNIIGNSIGYFLLDLFGPQSLRFYDVLRNVLRENVVIATLVFVAMLFIVAAAYKIIFKRIEKNEKKIVIFGFLFFIISLLPFLGLGNISSRYSYLSSAGFVILFVFFVKKAFSYLLSISDKYTTFVIVILISIIFASVQLFQLQNLHTDWNVAGEKTQRFLISFERIYKDYWVDRRMHFYFVDVPIRNGEAWVFPVGLNDALWFVLPNKEHLLDQVGSVEEAFSRISDPKNSNVFRFDADGRIHEYQKRADGSIVPIE